VEDGLGAAYREVFPLGYDGSARDSDEVSAEDILPVLAEAVIVRL